MDDVKRPEPPVRPPQPAPAVVQPPAPVAPPQQAPAVNDAPLSPVAPAEQPLPPVSAGTPQPSGTHLAVTILTGVFISFALIGVAYLAYRSSQNKSSESATTQTVQQPAATQTATKLDTTSEVTQDSVDKEEAEARKLVDGLQENKDFPEKDVSDNGLGL